MGLGIWVFKTPFKPSVSINEVKTNIEKTSSYIKAYQCEAFTLFVWYCYNRLTSTHHITWQIYGMMKFQAVTSCCYLGPQQAEMLQTLWIAGRAAGYLKCSICGFAPRSISLTVNCPLMFYTLIILFTSSKCASSVHSFVFLSMCLAYPHAPLIMCPLQEALFSQRIRFITMSVKRQ